MAYQIKKSKASDERGTPGWVMDAVTDLFGHHHLDVCATDENRKCYDWFTKELDGLTHPWYSNNWCNPPYSDPKPWVLKAISEAEQWQARTTLLLLADTSTELFSIAARKGHVFLLDQRIKFEGMTSSPPFGSMLVRITPCTVRGGTISRLSIRDYLKG